MAGVKGRSGIYKRPLKLCIVKSCNKKHYCKGLCKSHYRKQYRRDNKEKIRVYSKQYRKQYYQDHIEYFRDYGRREDRIEYMKYYYQDNKEQMIEWYKRWCKTEVGKASNKAYQHNRRLLTKDLTKEIVQKVYEANIARFGVLTCYSCFKLIIDNDDSLEHLIPVSRGGGNEYDNLAVAHRGCNSKKHTKTLDEYYMKI